MVQLSRRTVLTQGVAMTAAIAAAGSAVLASTDSELEKYIEPVLADALAKHACPGVSLAVYQAGLPLYSRGFGLSNIETQSPVTERTVFRIGSLTKQFTAAATMKLASVSRLHLETSAENYLPALRSLKRFTILELLNHTAGLRSDEGNDSTPSPQQSRRRYSLLKR